MHCGATVTPRSVLHQLRRPAGHRADQPTDLADTHRHCRAGLRGARAPRTPAPPLPPPRRCTPRHRRRRTWPPDPGVSRPGPGPGLWIGVAVAMVVVLVLGGFLAAPGHRRGWRRHDLADAADRAEDASVGDPESELLAHTVTVGELVRADRHRPARPTSPDSRRPQHRHTPRPASTSRPAGHLRRAQHGRRSQRHVLADDRRRDRDGADLPARPAHPAEPGRPRQRLLEDRLLPRPPLRLVPRQPPRAGRRLDLRRRHHRLARRSARTGPSSRPPSRR